MRPLSKSVNFPESTRHLQCKKRASVSDDGILCLALAHNEIKILNQFFEHYRAIGIKNFIIVDDRSEDGTSEVLAQQDDVTIYVPKQGSTYRQDKIAWRCDLLDEVAANKWVLLADIDEHLVYPKMCEMDIGEFSQQLEQEGSEALFAVMVDMYADKPLKEHKFEGGNLHVAFPYFDCPKDPVIDYRLLPPAKRFRKRFPTPPVSAYGGARDRMFFAGQFSKIPFGDWWLRKFANFNRPLKPDLIQRLANLITRTLCKRRFGPAPLSVTKISLIKWQHGMKLPGGPHAVSKKLELSNATSVFMHFCFIDGIRGFEYVAKRGQHAGGSMIYHSILDKIDAFELSPMCLTSRRYSGPQSLIDCGLMRVGNSRNSH